MTLDEWTAQAAGHLGIESPDGKEQRLVLDVAREVAHNVLRPAAPVSTFLLGYAVGRGMPLDAAAQALISLARSTAPSGEEE
jgi:hypothetical protein